MLSELPAVGERRAARIAAAASARGVRLLDLFALPAQVLARDYQLPLRAVACLGAARARFEAHCRHLLACLRAGSGAVCQPGDAAYPDRWLARARPVPPIVYVHGNPAIQHRPTFAILSSRGLTQRSVSACIQVIQYAAEAGLTLVTSGMKGTYRVAAVAGRAAGVPRIVVLDRGLLAAFGAHMDRDPFGFGPGRAAFDRERTLVMSPYRLADHAVPRNGARRDELVAALADVIVATSVRPGGTMERVCLEALDRGQCVLSWHGDHDGLLAAGATPIDETDLRTDLVRLIVTGSKAEDAKRKAR